MELYNINKKGRWEQVASQLNDNFGKVNAAVEQAMNKTTPNRGYYVTLQVLKEEVNDAMVGDIAYVGIQSPFDVYEYTSDGWTKTNGVHNSIENINLGNYYQKKDSDQRFIGYQREAEEINEIAPNLVNEALRKTPQVLTEDEQIQARKNIGAVSKNELHDLRPDDYYDKEVSDGRFLGYSVDDEEVEDVAPDIFTEALRKTRQTLSTSEKKQSRVNIGAASEDELSALASTVVSNKKDADEKIAALQNRVVDVTVEEWEELEKNKTWVEGVEYNVYEV